MVGEPFFVGVELEVQGVIAAPYAVSVGSDYQTLRTPVLPSFAKPGRYRVVWGTLSALGNRPLRLRATAVTSTSDRAIGTQATINVQVPSKAIEYHSPLRLAGSVGAEVRITRTTRSPEVRWWFPIPPSLNFQRPISAAVDARATRLDQPYAARVDRPAGDLLSGTLSFRTTASAVRVNPAKLRTATMASLLGLPAEARAWTAPEQLIPSRDRRIAEFARSAAPGDLTKRAVYDVAEALFLATIKRMTYVPLRDGKPSAIVALESGRGDCGYFSSLFIAACRNLGIPARGVVGMTEGEDAWHVWAEFYVPGHGWVPVDPAASDGLRPEGNEALYFGVIPDLNRRAVLSVGFDQKPGGQRVPFFQAPIGTLKGATARSYSPRCRLAAESTIGTP